MKFLAFTALSLLALAGGAGALRAVEVAQATKASAKENAVPDKERPKDALSMPPDREAAVLVFVKNNHPELADLLAVLKQSQPKEYQKALRDLFRSSERLATIFDQDRTRYELELSLWKAQSRIQLLAARLRVKADDKYREELKVVLTEQQAIKLRILELERQRVAERAARLDAEIARLRDDGEAHVKRQLEILLGTGKKPPKPKASAGETKR